MDLIKSTSKLLFHHHKIVHQFQRTLRCVACLPMTPQHLHIFLDLFIILNGFPRPHFLMNVFQLVFKPVNLCLIINIS